MTIAFLLLAAQRRDTPLLFSLDS